MKFLKRAANWALNLFRSNAVTLGISPKVLGAAITGAIIWLFQQADVTNLSTTLYGIVTVVAMSLAATILGPGQVAVIQDQVPSSDDTIPPDMQKVIDKAAKDG